MAKKILISDTAKIGTLGEFLDFVQVLKNEFEIAPVEIKQIHSDDRDMFIKFVCADGIIAIDYSYEYEKLYLDCIVGNIDNKFIDRLSLRINELIAPKV